MILRPIKAPPWRPWGLPDIAFLILAGYWFSEKGFQFWFVMVLIVLLRLWDRIGQFVYERWYVPWLARDPRVEGKGSQ